MAIDTAIDTANEKHSRFRAIVPLPLPLGCWASGPDGVYRGRIAAVFADYRAALKWGNWDVTHTAPGERSDEPYYLIQSAQGALLIGSRFARPAPAPPAPPVRRSPGAPAPPEGVL